MKLTYEALLEHPEIIDRLVAQARRERAQAVNELIIQPVKRFFADRAPRLNLARQG